MLKKHFRPFIGGGVEAKPSERSFSFYSYGFNSKPLLIMAKVRTVFLDADDLETELLCYEQGGKIFIQIDDDDDPIQYIRLDVSTAIKLSKTLRTEINKAKEVGDE